MPTYRIKIGKWGKSLGVRLPADAARARPRCRQRGRDHRGQSRARSAAGLAEDDTWRSFPRQDGRGVAGDLPRLRFRLGARRRARDYWRM